MGLAGWELDFWGRVRNLKDAAPETYLATDEARRAITVSLVAQVADTYLALRELDERIALARKAIASREESFRIFNRRFEVGATARMEETPLHQAGMVTVNSTSGVRAIQLGCPVTVLGEAIYNVDGLTHLGGLGSLLGRRAPCQMQIWLMCLSML